MKVNHNMSAVTVNNQLVRTENALTASIERLSSGFKINHAKDDAAGMAISNKMMAQIDGLNRASRNSSDGTSVIQTADGALNEVTSIVQRMRELAVQAANDTNALEDKRAIQSEIDSLLQEIDRVASDTEFNTQTLLDGTQGRKTYANNDGISNVIIADEVDAAKYDFTVTSVGTQAEKSYTATGSVPDGTLSINGVNITFSSTDTPSEAYEKLREGCEQAGVELSSSTDAQINAGDTLTFTSIQYGASETMTISTENDDVAAFLGLTVSTPDVVSGSDAAVSIDASDFPPGTTVAADGNYIKITNVNGFSMQFDVDPTMAANSDVTLDVTNIGYMTLQVGANEGQTINISIPPVTTEAMRISDIDVTVMGWASEAITKLDDALSYVSSVRSKLGAYENRLDYTVDSLDEFEENMNSALSRIKDVDMAKEMSEYTKQNVLDQAAISVLSQANDIPQTVLQILQ